MPYQPAPFFHVRPAYEREPADRPRAARPLMARPAKVAAALLAVTTIMLAGAGIALGAPTSARLSAQGWRTLQGFQTMDLNVDTDHPERARGQLATYIARCSDLPGRGAQSSGLRALCRDTLGFLDQTLGVGRCERTEAATCLAGHLPAINHAMDGNVGAALTVAATLLPGRCRTGFATEARASAAVAANGRAFRTAVIAGDPTAVATTMTAWAKAVDRWSDDAAGPDAGSCRPLR